ncbi:MAG: FAD-dependent thymidylate synthase [Eubacterium sp.]|jgi:thymidylate synthase (FAD)|nr:FAD-dependent thymidylate synthase [Eubacterium sp.]
MKIIKPSIEIVDMDNYESILKKIEKIGRVCYKSEERITEDSAEKFIRNLLTRQHESVIEHESVTVRIICDRGVTHEIVRHRIASYSQESTRYCNYAGDKFDNQITVIDLARGFSYDLSNENDKAKYEVWTTAMKQAEQAYFRMLELGATPQEARAVLPNSLKTEIVVTMNLRSWRNFFRLRVDSHAHPQMREVAQILYKEFADKLPVFVSGLEIS